MTRIWISKIKFNDLTEIDIEPNDILVFVGANNVGKSESLKEIDKLLQSNNCDVPLHQVLYYFILALIHFNK